MKCDWELFVVITLSIISLDEKKCTSVTKRINSIHISAQFGNTDNAEILGSKR